MKQSIGLDVGHSAVKIATNEGTDIIVAAATIAPDLSTAAARTAAESDTVTMGKEKWLVGESALIHTLGRVTDGLRDDWMTTPEYAALLKAGYLRAIHKAGEEPEALVVGLPSRLFASQKDRLAEVVSSTVQLDKGRVAVMPQPLAAFFTTYKPTDEDAVPAEADGSWVIIDIGYYTTDFGLVNRAIWSEQASQSAPGVAYAADVLRQAISTANGIDVPVRKCAEILRTKSMRYDGSVQDMTPRVNFAAEQFGTLIMERAERVFGDKLHDADGIMVVGGGAELAFGAIHKRWKHATLPENPRFAVAIGMQRAGAL